MRKKLILCLLILTLSSASIYATTTKEQEENFKGGYTIGLSSVNNYFGPLTSYYLTTGYIHPNFSFDFGLNYFHTHKWVDFYPEIFHNHDDYLSVVAHIGPRNRIYNNLFVSYGVTGSYFCPIQGAKNIYSVGVYTGLDLQVTKHLLLSGKVYPFNFVHPTGQYRVYKVFGSGTLGTSYVF